MVDDASLCPQSSKAEELVRKLGKRNVDSAAALEEEKRGIAAQGGWVSSLSWVRRRDGGISGQVPPQVFDFALNHHTG